MNSKIETLYTKINNNDNIIVFGLSTCIYCKKTLELLKDKKIRYKYYNIYKYYNLFFKIFIELGQLYPNLNIDIHYKTIPIIFDKKKFIGGYNELVKLLK
jgi:glutaredoxin